MSTATTLQIKSTSSEVTEELAASIGRQLRGGEVIELVSDLGGGKTTFVRGLARGAGSDDKVASPTFTVSKEYDAKRFTIHHFDFYRLQEAGAGIVADELAEVASDSHDVVVVEWADVVHHVLPANRLTITIRQLPSGDRQLQFHTPVPLAYLLKEVQRTD